MRQADFEKIYCPVSKAKERVIFKAYPVREKGGAGLGRMGPQPSPILPDWEASSWTDGFTLIVLSEMPCNWFQCQDNSIDPVHFEWRHENWVRRLRTGDTTFNPTHLGLEFEDFEHGFVYKRIKQNSTEYVDPWTVVGRVCRWPNEFSWGVFRVAGIHRRRKHA